MSIIEKNTVKNRNRAISVENVGEAIKSIKDNKLRTALTVAIIAVGIMSLVGILTAIDSIEHQIVSGMSELGANSFDVRSKRNDRRRRGGGRRDRNSKPITFRESLLFKKKFAVADQVSISTSVTGSAEIKFGSEKTNPNSRVIGGDENYLSAEGLDLDKGRNFSTLEGQNGAYVALVGKEIVETLFKNTDPIDQEISINGNKYTVVGTLKEKGGLGGNSSDRVVVIPIINANILGNTRQLNYTITVLLEDANRLDEVMGEARGLMRILKGDKLGMPDSFEVNRNESLAESMSDMTGNLRIAAFAIGAITLLGASIGLMNIMLVSVTERTREIGVRKSLGAAPKHIRQQFLVEAITICQIGGVTGVVLGIIIGNVIAKFMSDGENFAFVVPWLWMLIGLVICVCVGVLSGFYPANRAAKLDPIESLRYE